MFYDHFSARSLLAETGANVVIELFIIYKADYSLYNGSFWYSREIPQYLFSKHVFHTPVITLSRIPIVSGHI